MELIARLKADFGQFSFEEADENLWLPEKNKILYIKNDPVGVLHELGHALGGHKDFTQDIELLHAERDAWDKALELSKKYGVKINSERVETAMDWYRDWLHARSACPECSQNGIQQRANGYYKCLNCETTWQANDARQTGLKRYKQK